MLVQSSKPLNTKMSLVTKFFGSRFFHQRKGHQQMAREDYVQAVLGRMMGLEGLSCSIAEL
jgi:hypothetical protein